MKEKLGLCNLKDKQFQKAQRADDHIKSMAGVIGLLAVGSIIFDVITNIGGKRVYFNFYDYYIADLRVHWKEMIEAKIMEDLIK